MLHQLMLPQPITARLIRSDGRGRRPSGAPTLKHPPAKADDAATAERKKSRREKNVEDTLIPLPMSLQMDKRRGLYHIRPALATAPWPGSAHCLNRQTA